MIFFWARLFFSTCEIVYELKYDGLRCGNHVTRVASYRWVLFILATRSSIEFVRDICLLSDCGKWTTLTCPDRRWPRWKFREVAKQFNRRPMKVPMWLWVMENKSMLQLGEFDWHFINALSLLWWFLFSNMKAFHLRSGFKCQIRWFHAFCPRLFSANSDSSFDILCT